MKHNTQPIVDIMSKSIESLNKLIMNFDLSKIDNVELEDVFTFQYPEFEDAFISAATYNGIEMTEEQLDRLNVDESEFVYNKVMEQLY